MSLDQAPSWFLVFVITVMTGVGGPVMAWVAIKYFGSLHRRLDSFDAKFEQLISGLNAYTPINQHISAYEKLHSKIDMIVDRLIRVEEHQK